MALERSGSEFFSNSKTIAQTSAECERSVSGKAVVYDRGDPNAQRSVPGKAVVYEWGDSFWHPRRENAAPCANALIFVNLAGEMLYILEQRLQAQFRRQRRARSRVHRG